jgi:hypothetical protein
MLTLELALKKTPPSSLAFIIGNKYANQSVVEKSGTKNVENVKKCRNPFNKN